jgi:hypothetical protein
MKLDYLLPTPKMMLYLHFQSYSAMSIYLGTNKVLDLSLNSSLKPLE